MLAMAKAADSGVAVLKVFAFLHLVAADLPFVYSARPAEFAAAAEAAADSACLLVGAPPAFSFPRVRNFSAAPIALPTTDCQSICFSVRQRRAAFPRQVADTRRTDVASRRTPSPYR